MSGLRNRSLTAALGSGLLTAAMVAGGVLSASAADYASDSSAIGLSPADAWTASAAGVASVVGDADRGGSVLQLTVTEGKTARVLHYLKSGAFPTVDAALGTSWSRLIDGTRDPGSTIPYSDPATANVVVSAGAELFLDMELSYLDPEGNRDTTIMACALPATASWSSLDLSDCNYDLLGGDWKLTGWMTTEEWSYLTDDIPARIHTYPEGSVISGVSNSALDAYPIAIGFRVEGPAGAAARIDDFVIRDSALSFTAAPTTTTFTVTTAGASVPGVKATLTATVAPSAAAGSIRFADGGTTVAEGPVVDGVFTATTDALSAGTHALTAEFTPADEGAYTASSANPIAFGVNAKDDTPADPPVDSTEELLDLPGVNIIPREDFTPGAGTEANADGSFDTAKPFSGEAPWSEPEDSFADVYLYSTPVFLGTFPVVNGVVQLSGLDLSGVAAGTHHLVFIGQTTGSVSLMEVYLMAALANTGADIGLPLFAGTVLLMVGIGTFAIGRSRRTAPRR